MGLQSPRRSPLFLEVAMFYCLLAEFRPNCEPKANVVWARKSNEKPRNTYSNQDGQIFKIWFVSQERAREVAEGVVNKTLDVDDINYFYTDMTSLEKAA